MGPGLKSMTKFKKRKEEQLQLKNNNKISTATGSKVVNAASQNSKSLNLVSERFSKIFKKTKKKKPLNIAALQQDDNTSKINLTIL